MRKPKILTLPTSSQFLFLVLCQLLICSYRVQCGTLPPPQPPVKVLVEAGVTDPADRLRYYTFSEENGVGVTGKVVGVSLSVTSEGPIRNDDSVSGFPPPRPSYPQQGPNSGGGRNPDVGKFSRDPFEVPSLAVIAEMMRARDKQNNYGGGDRPEHREGSSGGWGWKPPRPPPPPTKGWGWSQENSGQGSGSGRGSSSPVDNRDAFKPWQDGGEEKSSAEGWGWSWGPTTTTPPPYTPKYLASNEDKYRPIRYPPSVTRGWATEVERGSGPPGGGGPGTGSSIWTNSGQGQSQNNGYLPPPQREPPNWPSRERERDRPPSGWDPNSNSRYPPPPSSSYDSGPPTQVPPPLWPSSRDRDRDDPPQSGGGGGWGPPPPPRPPPPTTPPSSGWGGWDPPTSRRPGPFEYRPGIDDLTLHIGPAVDIRPYEKSHYPPGIHPSQQQRRRRPSSNSIEEEDSQDDEDYGEDANNNSRPRKPNHYRIVAFTPSPEEIEEIIRRKQHPKQKGEEGFKQPEATYLPPKNVPSPSPSSEQSNTNNPSFPSYFHKPLPKDFKIRVTEKPGGNRKPEEGKDETLYPSSTSASSIKELKSLSPNTSPKRTYSFKYIPLDNPPANKENENHKVPTLQSQSQSSHPPDISISAGRGRDASRDSDSTSSSSSPKRTSSSSSIQQRLREISNRARERENKEKEGESNSNSVPINPSNSLRIRKPQQIYTTRKIKTDESHELSPNNNVSTSPSSTPRPRLTRPSSPSSSSHPPLITLRRRPSLTPTTTPSPPTELFEPIIEIEHEIEFSSSSSSSFETSSPPDGHHGTSTIPSGRRTNIIRPIRPRASRRPGTINRIQYRTSNGNKGGRKREALLGPGEEAEIKKEIVFKVESSEPKNSTTTTTTLPQEEKALKDDDNEETLNVGGEAETEEESITTITKEPENKEEEQEGVYIATTLIPTLKNLKNEEEQEQEIEEVVTTLIPGGEDEINDKNVVIAAVNNNKNSTNPSSLL